MLNFCGMGQTLQIFSFISGSDFVLETSVLITWIPALFWILWFFLLMNSSCILWAKIFFTICAIHLDYNWTFSQTFSFVFSEPFHPWKCFSKIVANSCLLSFLMYFSHVYPQRRLYFKLLNSESTRLCSWMDIMHMNLQTSFVYKFICTFRTVHGLSVVFLSLFLCSIIIVIFFKMFSQFSSFSFALFSCLVIFVFWAYIFHLVFCIIIFRSQRSRSESGTWSTWRPPISSSQPPSGCPSFYDDYSSYAWLLLLVQEMRFWREEVADKTVEEVWRHLE